MLYDINIDISWPKHRKGAYIMYESNEMKENTENNAAKENYASSLLLKEMIIENEERLYSIKSQIKVHQHLLKQKEDELSERERTKLHNVDLFSPLYNKLKEEDELKGTIQQIESEVGKLIREQDNLIDKNNKLKNAVAVIDGYEELIKREKDDTAEQAEQDVSQFNDKGLSILEAQEVERQRIARDLHDSTVQNLTSLVHKAELCIKLIDIDPIRAKLELKAMSNTIKSVINDMRGIIYNLKPMSLDDIGLLVTIERFAGRLMDLNNINVIVHSNAETMEIHPVIKLTLFRIIQEACNNVIKHAQATEICININFEEHRVTVAIIDNGTGFLMKEDSPEEKGHSSSFGLSIMKERISLLSGKVEIKSERGLGTTVTVSAPLTIYEGDKDEQTS